MFRKRKVPRPYSGAEDGAPSLTGARDDEFFEHAGYFYLPLIQTDPLRIRGEICFFCKANPPCRGGLLVLGVLGFFIGWL